MKEALEKRLEDLYLANADMIGEGMGSSVNRPRSEALEVLHTRGIPHRGTADGDRYRYIDPYEALDADYEHYFTPSYTQQTQTLTKQSPNTLSLLNGFCATPDELTHRDDGVVYGSLRAATTAYPELFERYYNLLAADHGDAITALKTVFTQDGAFVYVPRNVQATQPLCIDYGYYGEEERIALTTRNLFIIEQGASLRIETSHRSLNDAAVLDLTLSEWFVGDRAQVDCIESIRLNSHSKLFADSFARQQRSSRLRTVTAALEGELVRGNHTVDLAGEGADNHTYGLMLSGKDEQIDFYTTLRHMATDCTSREEFRSVASQGGMASFFGRIYVAPDSQRTEAYQQSNNLLLDNLSHVHTKPQLEIYADDVKCSHGATVGSLDDEAIYYMRQRGISAENARKLQMEGFVNHILDRIESDRTPELEAWTADKIRQM